MKKILSLIVVFILALIVIPKASAANKPLDYIHSFEITVTTNSDATLNMDYHIVWEVLDDKEEGPLDWVKIGVANKYVDDIRIQSSQIKDAYYYNDNGSSTIRCDLVKKYYEGDIVDIHFSFHQSRIFGKMDENSKYVEYQFIPGWFDDITIGKITINWSKDAVYYNDAKTEDDHYYIWYTSLGPGQKTKVNVSYEKEVFPNINIKDSYVGPTDNDGLKLFIIILIIAFIFFIVVAILSTIFRRPSYYRTRGFYPYGRRFFYRNYYYGVNSRGDRKVNPYVSSGGGGHSGHSCACACACACAGGGRAGCSKKDFYKGNIKIEDIIDEL